MGFNLGKALHALVGFTPVASQVARVAGPQRQKPHPNSPSREQISKFNQNMVDSAQRSGSPFPVQPGSISPANPDGTWLRQNLGLQVGQPSQFNTGIQTQNQPQQGFGQQVQGVGSMPVGLQGMPGARNTRQLQRPSFNPQVEDQGYYYY